MSKKRKDEIIAGIDVGSHALRMKVAEVEEGKRIRLLEVLRQPISLGKDTFAMGKVSFETVDETCEILKGFKRLMSDYHIKTYRAVATSAIREAKNRDYIIDQIKLKTGLNMDVISNSEERFLTYKSIDEKIPNYQKIKDEGAMILDIGSGSIQVSIYSEGSLVFSQNIKLGSLRIREVLSSIEGRTLNFPRILEEYIASNIDRLKIFQSQDTYKHFIALGGEIKTISKLCNHGGKHHSLASIRKEDFESVYKKLMYKSTHSITKEYGISFERADILLPSMMLFKKFMDMTAAKGIHVPLVSLSDGIISDITDKCFNTNRKKVFEQDIISSARFISKRYRYDQAHAEDVEVKALFLFDELSKLHGLGHEERLLLQLAAILHDTGKFIDMNQHYIHSYEIIMASDLIGISKESLTVIANVARYHSRVVPHYTHENYQKLDEKTRIIVAKLVAIIRLADALDRSHKQKLKDMKVQLEEKRVIIRVDAVEDALLEEWTFETKAEFFQEVFGVTPILKVKRKISHE
ncbi:HD domain-containing protein [Petroclostridium sp. X23]|uniref:Ppx/GppA phosphatase family protein n=1 Tax=Petroclostridium sp. X23 TaxID=3045146 RepID=UPI0024AD95C5|nr:HD domain-containing protein [Petroclostridium sp. X23]WHH60708.1 HD domain-containing protein [Petroclostridium sp. X23]